MSSFNQILSLIYKLIKTVSAFKDRQMYDTLSQIMLTEKVFDMLVDKIYEVN